MAKHRKIIGLMRFARDCGMHLVDAVRLIKLSSEAKVAEELRISYRDPTGIFNAKADGAGAAVEEFAAKFGLKTTWPGLWPVFQKDERDIFLPD